MNVPRILIATAGSLGDLNPMLAIGEQLLASGAEVSFATLACYEDACRKSGFGFQPLGNSDDYLQSLRYTRVMLEQDSFEQIVDRTNFDQLEVMYTQLLAAVTDADVLMAPSHVVAAHLVAEKRRIPYVACALSLLHFKSPAESGSPEHKRISASAARWHSLLRKFRQDHGLARRLLPFTSLLCDATRVLGVLPPFLMTAAESRIPNLEVVGYANHRQSERMFQDRALREFCDQRTVAFSFGSFADSCDPDHFFMESVNACRALGLKSVYLSRHVTAAMQAASAPDVMIRADVAPGAVFPLVGLCVHHGGTGSLAVACTHRTPMMIVPFFLDQPLHAARMQDLIGAPLLAARHYRGEAVVQALRRAVAQRDSMKTRLDALMVHDTDGAEQASRSVLSMVRRDVAQQSR